MNLRRVTLGSGTFIEAGILLAFLLVLNTFACYNPARLDLTEFKEYTLSDATRRVLGNLDEIVQVRAYVSSDLPPEYMPIRTEIIDFLNSLQQIANDKFKLTIVEQPDPAKEQLEIKGIQPIQFQVRKEGEASVKTGYMGIWMQRLTKTDVLPAVVSSQNLEYDLISAIYRISQKETETGKISITQGNGEPEIEDPNGIQAFVKTMRDLKFTVFPTTLDDKTEIPITVRTLLVPSPKTLSTFDKFQIDQLLMRGGNVIFCVDRFDLPVDNDGNPSFTEAPVERPFGGADLLEFYGVKAEPKLLGDPSAESVQYRQGMMIMNHPYPFWIRVPPYNLSKDHPAVNRLELVDFPWANPLRLLDENIKAHPGVSVDILAQSTVAAWALSPDDDNFKGLAPWNYQQQDAIAPDSISYPLAVELSGTFKSYFAGKDDPVGDRRVSPDRERLDESEKPGRVIVLATGKFLTGPEQSGWWAQFRPNQVFMANLMDYLNLGDELLGLRSRQVKVRPLEKQWVPEADIKARKLSPQEERTITLLNVLLMPALLIAFGLVSFSLKASRKKAYEARMRQELAIDTKLSAAERAEMAMEGGAQSGFSLPLASIAGIAALFLLVLGLVMWQLDREQKERQDILAQQESQLFPDFNQNEIDRFEIWEILGKYVFRQSGDHWLVGHVSYTPDKSEEERTAAMPQEDQYAMADKRAVEAVLNGIGQMQAGILITEDDVAAVQTYVGRIGSEYRMYDTKGKLVAKFVVGKATEDFTGTYVQVRPPEQRENFPVYRVPGYLEPVYKKKSLLDWWDKKLFNMPGSALSKIQIQRKGQGTLTVERGADNAWQITEPAGWTADASKLSDWVDFVGDLQVAGWMEQSEMFRFQQEQPNWGNADVKVQLWPLGGGDPSPLLQIITDEQYAQFGGNLSRMGEGILFHMKDSDLQRLRATEADFQAVKVTDEPAEAPAADAAATDQPAGDEEGM